MRHPSLHTLLKKLKTLRKRHSLTQEAFAEIAGISYKYYQSVETGKQEDLRLSTLDRLAKAYGVEGWQLLAPTFPKSTRLAKRHAGRPHYSKRSKV